MSIPGLLFHDAWWLEAASGGQFDEVRVEHAGEVIGRLPYVARRRMGFRLLGMPDLTHVLGPVVAAGRGKPQTQLRHCLTVLRELLERLPPHDFFMQSCEPALINVLAFQHCGFAVKPQCNFRIDCRTGLDALLQQMHFKTRGHIHKAERDYEVSGVEDPDTFVTFYRANMLKTGRRDRIEFGYFARLVRECRARDSGEIIAAHTRSGTPAAMAYLVWGGEALYYLLASRAPGEPSANAANLLVWTAIKRAHERGLVFDFDGVVHAGQMQFFLGFGGQLCSRLIATRSRSLYRLARYARGRIAGSRSAELARFT